MRAFQLTRALLTTSLSLAAVTAIAAGACNRPGELGNAPTEKQPGVTAPQGSAGSGSPSATTSIDSTHLPPPPPRFGGVMKAHSTSRNPGGPRR